jgi:hypothetical protein
MIDVYCPVEREKELAFDILGDWPVISFSLELNNRPESTGLA